MKIAYSAIVSLPAMVCAAALLVCSRADAQQKRPMPPPLPAHFSDHIAAKYHQLSLKQIVGIIDSVSGLNILIDGEPLTPRADLEFDGTLEEALNKVADTFDYKWKAGKGGIVLFNKRFTNKDDAPQAGLPEMIHLIKSMSDIFALANVDPDPSQWVNHLNQLGQSLTDTQRAYLLTGKRMSARELSPDQFLHLRSAVMNNTFAEPMNIWSSLAEHLRNLSTAYLVAQRQPDSPAQPGGAQYDYKIVWHNRDGSLTSENFLIHFFGSD